MGVPTSGRHSSRPVKSATPLCKVMKQLLEKNEFPGKEKNPAVAYKISSRQGQSLTLPARPRPQGRPWSKFIIASLTCLAGSADFVRVPFQGLVRILMRPTVVERRWSPTWPAGLVSHVARPTQFCRHSSKSYEHKRVPIARFV